MIPILLAKIKKHILKHYPIEQLPFVLGRGEWFFVLEDKFLNGYPVFVYYHKTKHKHEIDRLFRKTEPFSDSYLNVYFKICRNNPNNK